MKQVESIHYKLKNKNNIFVFNLNTYVFDSIIKAKKNGYGNGKLILQKVNVSHTEMSAFSERT